MQNILEINVVDGKVVWCDKLPPLDGILTGVWILEPEKLINRNMSYRNQLKRMI